MKVLFIAALNNLEIHGSFGRGIRLPGNNFLTNDPSLLTPLLSEMFERTVGLIETRNIREAPAVIYGISQQDEATFNEKGPSHFLNQQMLLMHELLLALWLVKDNATNFELAFVEHPHRPLSFSSVTSNSWPQRLSNASGEFSPCEFSETEVKTARDLCNTLFVGFAGAIDTTPIGVPQSLPSDTVCLERVLYFLTEARRTSDLGRKIAGYVTCFEALFCTDAAELAHKLSERLAFFCGDTPAKRLEIFTTAKIAYGIRSKTVHGGGLPRKLASQVTQVATECDGLLRTVLCKMLGVPGMLEMFNRPGEAIDKYLTRLVFGVDDLATAGLPLGNPQDKET